MVNRIALITIITFLSLLFSCEKYECVKDVSPQMIGDWTHYSENDGFHTIYIRENGRGAMYGINDHGNTNDPQERGWYIKDDVLYFSRFQNKVANEKFDIDLYPVVADTMVSDEYNSIGMGDSYLILNGRIYKKE